MLVQQARIELQHLQERLSAESLGWKLFLATMRLRKARYLLHAIACSTLYSRYTQTSLHIKMSRPALVRMWLRLRYRGDRLKPSGPATFSKAFGNVHPFSGHLINFPPVAWATSTILYLSLVGVPFVSLQALLVVARLSIVHCFLWLLFSLRSQTSSSCLLPYARYSTYIYMFNQKRKLTGYIRRPSSKSCIRARVRIFIRRQCSRKEEVDTP